MARDSSGSKNQPQYSSSGVSSQAADLSEVANYAANLGNRRVDTAAVRASLTGSDLWPNLEFEETDTGRVYKYLSSSWVLVSSGVGGSVKRSGAATFTAGIWTQLTNTSYWAIDQPAAGGLVAFAGTWVAPIAGLYDVRLGLQLDTTVNAILCLKKNDSSASSAGNIGSINMAGQANFTAGSVSKLIRMNAGDYVAGAIFVAAGSNAVWNTASPDASFFSFRWVEALR